MKKSTNIHPTFDNKNTLTDNKGWSCNEARPFKSSDEELEVLVGGLGRPEVEGR